MHSRLIAPALFGSLVFIAGIHGNALVVHPADGPSTDLLESTGLRAGFPVEVAMSLLVDVRVEDLTIDDRETTCGVDWDFRAVGETGSTGSLLLAPDGPDRPIGTHGIVHVHETSRLLLLRREKPRRCR